MKIGVIYCCYGNPEYVGDCINPWRGAKEKHNILIAAVHGQFKEYHELGIDDNDYYTIDRLKWKNQTGVIDNLYIQNDFGCGKNPIYQTEAEIRDNGLQWLLKEKCDIIWLLDNDERYTVEDINNIIKYIDEFDNKFYAWFSINFKNYVFDGKQWIDGFCPPRIFRTKYPSYVYNFVLNKCYWDNDFEYISDTGLSKTYKEFSSKEIPRKIAHVKHLTWLHENGEQKEKYQREHFGGVCSYKFNKETQKLEFDIDGYYKKLNLPLSELHKE